MYADIIVDISLEKLDRTFQYHIPEELLNKIRVGTIVEIPFGNSNRIITGYVIGLTEKMEFDPKKIKDILRTAPGKENIESRLIALAGWIRSKYGSTMNQALKTVLPVKRQVKAREKREIKLLLSPEKTQEYLREARRKKYTRRVQLLETLLNQPQRSMDYTQAAKDLQITTATLKPLEKAGVLQINSNRVYRGTPKADGKKEQKQCPNASQKEVIEAIQEEFKQGNRPCLIHGVTGSGKTLIYMELISQMLDQGKQAIVLIPEIALTYQTVNRFYEAFGEQVAILHSRLSSGERYDQMEQAKKGRVQVMIGPRSALFTPFPHLGLIVIDEEHENTYKSETMPRYHAREVAIERARLEEAHVVMGSATPSIDSAYKAKMGEYAWFELGERFAARPLPRVDVVDMRQELKEGNRSIISEKLQAAIEQRLKKGEQTMLFLNRRGYAGFVSCRACGYVVKCKHCDVSMSLHNNGRLICHYCGYEVAAYDNCPSCGSGYIGGFKAGTQQIEKTVQKMFPASRILRMDFDTTRKKDGYEKILDVFAKKEADILIGTQMIVKGHDFPGVTLVGVLAADLSLNGSDFRSGERTFQLLTQAVGRAGRGTTPGDAYIQTYQPEHYSIQAAVTQDYHRFYEEEMGYRGLMDYPPASGMLAILGGCKEEELLGQAMAYLKEYILRLDKNHHLAVIGPAPMAVSKVQDIYRQVIYVKGGEGRVLGILKDKMEEYIEINRGYDKIDIQFDFHI